MFVLQGMGGQFEYFGIWLDAEFGKGHCSETCTTYRNYKMLSATKHFEVDQVEVWAVGPEFEKKDSEVCLCELYCIGT
jgi:hypothetical protein